jgi:aldehyde dehydrogenase (NAD+)
VREVGEVIPAQVAGALQFTLREPLGVVALITPWNFPVAIPLWKTAPGAGVRQYGRPQAGRDVVARRAAARRDGIAAGLPAGVFNVLPGSGAVIGEALVRAPDVAAVSFTGSGRIGAMVASIAAERNIRYQTEMGGKNVAIVLPDADIAQAASLTAAGRDALCRAEVHATSRVVVAHEVEGRFSPSCDARSKPRARAGHGRERRRRPGDQRARARFDSRALDASDAERVYEGRIPDSADFSKRLVRPPTVLRGARPIPRLAQRELFGPVLAMFPRDDLDHAIALANDSAVRAQRVAVHADLRARSVRRRIEAGSCA